jgi:hypothetical protein
MAGGELGKAIELIKGGNIGEGKEILLDLLEQNDQNEEAWAWLHECGNSNFEKIYCLQSVLELDPHNEDAKVKLAQLTGKPYKKFVEDTDEGVRPKPIYIPKQWSTQKEPKPRPKNPPYINKPHIIFTKPGENLFEEINRTTVGLPDINAGMYWNRFFIGDLVITPFDYPDCIEDGHLLERSNCDICEFFGYDDCPIRHDPDMLVDVRPFLTGKKRFWKVSDERRQSMVDAVYIELKKHCWPLPYEILANIVKDQYPFLGLSPLRVLFLMERHPERFECVGQGVYRVK